MSSSLIPYAPPSITRVTIAWLTAFFGAGNAGARRPSAAVLPYRMVTTAAGTETVERVRRCATVSVHTFAANMDQAEFESDITHQRMLLLGPPNSGSQQVTITRGDGSTRVVTPDSITTEQIPIWVDYEDDEIFRFVGRYEICVRFAPNI